MESFERRGPIKKLGLPDLDAVLEKQARIFGSTGEIPRTQMIGATAEDGPQSLLNRRYVALAAEFGDKAAVGAKGVPYACYSSVCMFYPMQGRIGKDGIELSSECEFRRVGLNEGEAREIEPGLSKHVGRVIQTDHARASLCDFSSKLPGSAADIQNLLANVRVEQSEQA